MHAENSLAREHTRPYKRGEISQTNRIQIASNDVAPVHRLHRNTNHSLIVWKHHRSVHSPVKVLVTTTHQPCAPSRLCVVARCMQATYFEKWIGTAFANVLGLLSGHDGAHDTNRLHVLSYTRTIRMQAHSTPPWAKHTHLPPKKSLTAVTWTFYCISPRF